MTGKGLVKVKEIYDFICPNMKFEELEKSISKTSILISDSGIICLDLFSASKILDKHIMGGKL